MEKRRWLAAAAAALGMLALILDSRTAFSGGAEGVALCIKTVIPALFPFLFLSGIFTAAFRGSNGSLLGFLGKLFLLPPSLSFLLVPAFLGGYPIGAQCLSQLCRSGLLEKKQAERMLCFCSNVGPAFVFGILSLKFERKWLVWAVWLIQILSAWTAARFFLVPGIQEYALSAEKSEAHSRAGMEPAIGAMLKICGWVILFRVIIEFLDKWFFHAVPPAWRVALIGLLELSNGCCSLNLIPQEGLRFVICNGILAFGGLCVAYQTGSVCPGMKLTGYYTGKVFQAAIALLLAYGIAFRSWLVLPAWLLATLLLPKYLQKRVEILRELMYNGNKKNGGMCYAVSQED